MIANSSLKTFTIGLDIVTEAPMHISALESGRYVPNDRKLVRYDSKYPGSLPCTLTRHMEVYAPHVRTGADGVEFETAGEYLPTIPANTLGGKLRRNAAQLIAESLLARGARLSADAWNTLCAGTARAEMRRSAATTSMVLDAKKDPYLAVFGGTGYAFTADLTVHEGWPVTETTLKLLRSPPQSAMPQSDGKLTMVLPLLKKDDVYDMRNIDMLEQLVGADNVAAYVASIQQGRVEKKARQSSEAEGAESKKTELTTVATIEAIKPGVPFALRFDLRSRGPAHIGLLLLCLQRLANDAQIGGKAAKGFGRFAVTSARLFAHDANGRSESGITLWDRTTGGMYAFTDHPLIREYVQAGQDYIDTVSAQAIEGFSAGPEDQGASEVKPPRGRKPAGTAATAGA